MNVFSRTKSLVIIIAILLVSNIAMLVYFLNRPDRKRPDSSEFLKKTIGFSREQFADFEKRKQLHRDSIGRYFKDMNDDKERFYRLLGKSPIDSSEFDSLANRIGTKQVMIEKAFFRHFQDVGTICTPEQKKMYDSLFPGELRKMMSGKWRK